MGFLLQIAKRTIPPRYRGRIREQLRLLLSPVAMGLTKEVVDRMDGIASLLDQRISQLETQVRGLQEHAAVVGQEALEAVTRLQSVTEQRLANQVQSVDRALQELRHRVTALQKTGPSARAAGPRDAEKESEVAKERGDLTDEQYVRLVKRLRGPGDLVRRQLRQYVPMLQGRRRVLDLGCGEGVLLELLREASIPAVGVDMNRLMVEECRRRQLTVEQADAIAYLRACEPGAFDAIVGIHVVEHLPLAALRDLFAGCYRVMPPKGLLLLESPNTVSPVSLSRHYFADPTHQAPRHPVIVQFLLEEAGFREAEITFIHPPGEESVLRLPESREGPGGDAWAVARANFEKLNHLLMIGLDYYIRTVR